MDSHGSEPKNMATSSGSIKRCSDISLQIPPRPGGFTSRQNGGDGLIHSSVASNDSSSSVGCLRALSFKKRTNGSDVERSLLSKSDPKTDPQSPVVSNRIPKLIWNRCTSLLVTRTPLLSPLIATPTSTRTYGETQRSQVMFSFEVKFYIAVWCNEDVEKIKNVGIVTQQLWCFENSLNIVQEIAGASGL